MEKKNQVECEQNERQKNCRCKFAALENCFARPECFHATRARAAANNPISQTTAHTIDSAPP